MFDDFWSWFLVFVIVAIIFAADKIPDFKKKLAEYFHILSEKLTQKSKNPEE